MGSIKSLRLQVALHKTEALFFHDGSRGAAPESWVTVDKVRVRIEPSIKYWGLMLDGRWDFGPHFRWLAPWVYKVGLALAGLMQNQGGPKMARSPPVYRGDPVMRSVVVRATRAFRTISYIAATTLTGLSPVELIAQERYVLYWRIKKLRGAEEAVSARGLAALKSRVWMMERWENILTDPHPGFERPKPSPLSRRYGEQKGMVGDVHLPSGADSNRPWVLWPVPAPDLERAHCSMSLLSGAGGHVPAHAGFVQHMLI
ncbi:uncharacterized protein LOC105181583 [Harpegnathos saltator]|uniref:uncharacterized protein LOC105181583 n=1 Tax=Harpegnathos saltator TaxID=610380 RepID=UPI000DBEEE4C|nr:uncharacterized protein LOC105181583 [Harpegnathos saltator]